MWSYIIAKSKSSAVIVMLMLLFSYFSYFAVKGDRGFLKYMYLQDKVAEAEKLNENYDRQKDELEQKVKLLSSSSLDLDLFLCRRISMGFVVIQDLFRILYVQNII